MAPSCTSSGTGSSEAAQQEAVAGCLGQLRPGTRHFQAKRLAFEIRDVGFTPAGSLSTLTHLVQLIYARATSDPECFSGPCAALCFSLTPILPTFKPPGAVTVAAKAKRIDFRQTLLNLCQREFETACRAAILDLPAEETPIKPSSSLQGGLQFLSYLYLHHLLTDRIMLSCLLTVAFGKASGPGDSGRSEDISGSNVSQRVEYLVKALTIAGRQLDECLAPQHRPLLDDLYDKLAAVRQRSGDSSSSSMEAPALPPEVHASVSQLLETRASGWPGGSAAAVPPATRAMPATAKPPAPPPNGHAARSTAAVPLGFCTPGSKSSSSGGAAAAAASLRLVCAAQGSGSASSGCPSSSPAVAGVSPAGLVSGPALRRPRASSGGGSASLRGSSQSLEGLYDLSDETYQEVRAQLLSSAAGTSPAALEAMADEIVECALAACGRRRSSTGGGCAPEQQPLLGSSPAGLAAEDSWSQQLQQQWEEQSRACELYARLCMEALQQWGAGETAAAGPAATTSPSQVDATPGCGTSHAAVGGNNNGNGNNGNINASSSACSPVAVLPQPPCTPSSSFAQSPATPPVLASDTARAFRRLLLSTAQSHFESCLAALLSASSPPAASPMTPSPDAPPPRTPHVVACQPSTASQQPSPDSTTAPAAPTPSPSSSSASSSGSSSSMSTPSPSTAAGRRSSGGGCGSGGSFSSGQQGAWGDLPTGPSSEAEVLRRARGMCHLLLGLLRYGILTPRIVLHCAAALVDGAAGGSDACLQCACVLLAGAGKQVQTFRVAEAAAFESLVKRLQQQGLTDPGTEAEPKVEQGAGGSVEAAGDKTASEHRRRYVGWLVGGLAAKAGRQVAS